MRDSTAEEFHVRTRAGLRALEAQTQHRTEHVYLDVDWAGWGWTVAWHQVSDPAPRMALEYRRGRQGEWKLVVDAPVDVLSALLLTSQDVRCGGQTPLGELMRRVRSADEFHAMRMQRAVVDLLDGSGR